MGSGERIWRAVLVDRERGWLDAIERVLARAQIAVVAKATAGEHGVSLVERAHPTVLIAGVEQLADGMSGNEVLRRACDRDEPPTAVAVSRSDERDVIEAAFAAGAAAFVLKSAPPEDLLSAIRQVFDPSIFLPAWRPAPLREQLERARSVGLTRRELEILLLVAEGHSNAELASLLWVTKQTIKFHLSNIYRKLEVSNRTEAARWAQAHGILAVPPPYDSAVA
jgi:two-component system, NarL family, response regulator DegU